MTCVAVWLWINVGGLWAAHGWTGCAETLGEPQRVGFATCVRLRERVETAGLQARCLAEGRRP